uniref:Uncharacterized protein n=1 Tax=Leersia perrieri TaxID=77586 RepID=A0A0D9W6Y3_9ORYZ
MELKSFLSWSSAIALHPPASALKNHVHVQAIHLPWLVGTTNKTRGTATLYLMRLLVYAVYTLSLAICLDSVDT